jgi:type II secretory pathway component PulC
MDSFTIRRLVDRIIVAGYAAAGLAGVGYGVAYVQLPGTESAAPSLAVSAPGGSWRATETPDLHVWEVFLGSESSESPGPGPLETRFRLAGTFLLEDRVNRAAGQRCAVLDDRDKDQQILVREGESIGEVIVARVEPSRVMLREGSIETVLTLEFLGPALKETVSKTPPSAASEAPWDQRVIDETRFGKRIAEDRWIMHRSELLRYRQELLDDPERLARLFMSMKAEREDGRIEGYRLKLEGEETFYAAIGLQEGDVVRKTNSMKMTKQERAEYFIREFVNNRLNVVVLDVERNNQPIKLIYYIR